MTFLHFKANFSFYKDISKMSLFTQKYLNFKVIFVHESRKNKSRKNYEVYECFTRTLQNFHSITMTAQNKFAVTF